MKHPATPLAVFTCVLLVQVVGYSLDQALFGGARISQDWFDHFVIRPIEVAVAWLPLLALFGTFAACRQLTRKNIALPLLGACANGVYFFVWAVIAIRFFGGHLTV